MNKKFAVIFAVAVLLGIAVSIGIFMAKKSVESREISQGELSIEENEQLIEEFAEEEKLLTESMDEEEIKEISSSSELQSFPFGLGSEEEEIASHPPTDGKYEYIQDKNMKSYPWIDHNGKRYYMQFGVLSQDPMNRTNHAIGVVEEGKTSKIDVGTEYAGHNYTDTIILTQNKSLSSYYVFSTKQLKYTKFENVVKDRARVKRARIYKNYYYDSSLPLPDKLSKEFLEDIVEIPFEFDSQTKPVEGAIDSLIYFDLGDGLVYSFRAYFKDGEVYIVDILYEKMYHVENSEYHKFDFLTRDRLAEEMPLGAWENVDETMIPDSVKEKLRKAKEEEAKKSGN